MNSTGLAESSNGLLKPRSVLIIDDHDLVRVGMETLLGNFGAGVVRVIHGHSLAEAKAVCERGEALDLVLLDLNLCDAKGLQGLRVLRECFPNLAIVILTGTQDDFVVNQARAMGARGYLMKSWSPDKLSSLLRFYLFDTGNSPPATADGGFGQPDNRHTFDRVAELGPRHLEILELILSGCNNREIANTTGLSIGTIKNYVSAILLALDVRSRGHLISLFH